MFVRTGIYAATRPGDAPQGQGCAARQRGQQERRGEAAQHGRVGCGWLGARDGDDGAARDFKA